MSLNPEIERRREAAAAKAAAKTVRAAERAAMIGRCSDELSALVATGDPVAIARRRPLGRAIDLAVRDQIAARPEEWARLIDALIAGLGHPDPSIRYECAHALDTYDDGRAAAALAPLIDDPAPRVRRMAIHALVCDACKVAAPSWSREVCLRVASHALTDASVNVRRHAVIEITRCDPALARQTLEAVRDHEADARTRRSAERQLKHLGGRTSSSPETTRIVE